MSVPHGLHEDPDLSCALQPPTIPVPCRASAPFFHAWPLMAGQQHVESNLSIPLNPPFRADHVGSFLRPAYLLQAREQHAKGEISAAQLREVEDRAITEIVKFQDDVGLKSITDGEYRRT